MSNTILRLYKTHVKKSSRKAARVAKKLDEKIQREIETAILNSESVGLKKGSLNDSIEFMIKHHKKHIALTKPNYTDDDPENAFAFMPEEILHPKHEATLQEIRIYNFGFREKRQLVSKPDTIQRDFETVPDEYFVNSESTVLHPKNLIEGGFYKIPEISCTSNHQYLIMVKSAIHHVEYRDIIRKTWGNENILKKYRTKMIFTVAKSESNQELNDEISEELRKFDDVIICDFFDSYYNVTKKVLTGMKYAVENCGSVKYVIHVDDDAYS